VDDLGSLALGASVDTAQTSPVATNTQSVTVTIPSGFGLIEGEVTAQGFGDAVPGAFVGALASSDFSVVGLDLTAADGGYRALVPPGSYMVYVADPAGAHLASFASLTPMTVVDGATVTVDGAVSRTLGGIEGRATDAGSGDGIAAAVAITTNAGTGQIDGGAVADGAGAWVADDLRAVPHRVIPPTTAAGPRPTVRASPPCSAARCRTSGPRRCPRRPRHRAPPTSWGR
jgi:hypothetical protein